MAIRRYEINALTGTITGSAAADGNYVIPLDTSKYSGTCTYYFEAVYSGAASNTGTVRLRRKGTTTDDATLTGITSATLTLTRSTFTPPAGALTEYIVRNNADGTRSQTIKAARIIVIQDDGGSLTACEHQFEVGNTETAKINTVAAALTAPKYWKYESANYDGLPTFYAEITWTLTGTGTGTVVLQESSATITAPTWSNKITIVSAGTAASPTRVRSLSFIPTDGRMYRITTVNSSSMGALSIYNAKIIVGQGYVINTNTNVGGANLGNNSSAGPLAQNFPYQAGTLGSINLTMQKVGVPVDNVFIQITDGLGGGVLATSNNVGGASISTSAAAVAFTFPSPATLSPDTIYYAVIQRSGSVDAANYYSVVRGVNSVFPNGFYQYDGSLWNEATNQALTIEFLTIFTIVTKTEDHYLLANTTLAAGTALQSFLSKWDNAEWGGVTNTYLHQVEASDGNTSVVEVDTAAGVQVTGSVVTSPDNIGQSTSMTMPSNGNLDVKATTNSGSVFGSRIIVKSVKSVIASIPNKIYSINQSVNRASNF